jgi:glycosyltransferase 2 family protein
MPREQSGIPQALFLAAGSFLIMIKILKQIGVMALRISISILLLVFLFRKVDGNALWQLIRASHKIDLAASVILVLIIDALCFVRWNMLLKASGVFVPGKTLLKSFCGGLFFNVFLPTSIGGDVIKTLDLTAHTRKGTEVASTVFLDRLSGYVALVIVVVAACILGWEYVQDKTVLLSVAAISGFLICILLVLFNRKVYGLVNRLLYSPTAGRIRQAVTDVHEEMHTLGKKKRVILLNLSLSMVLQLTGPVATYLVCRSLGAEINFIYFLIYLPIIGAITLLPISIGGLGLRDAATVYFFAKAGLSRDVAFAMSLLGFFIIVIIAAAGGLYYVLTLRHRRV